MARPASLEPSRSLNTHLSEREMARLDLALWSTLEGKIPRGAYKEFFEGRIRDFFDSRTLDLAPYTGNPPGESIVRGTPRAVEQLKTLLESQS